MTARRTLPLFLLALSASCSDSSSGDDKNPTAPEPIADRQSSVCRAYIADLGAATDSLEASPTNAALKQRVATFRAIIADACN